ncbi:MAG: hypothetical protein ACO2OX_04920 [Candidatus Nanopusillus sp.]
MRRTYKYLVILTFILNFNNIYSQSDNLISTWYDKAIHTLYLDKQLLESAANALSQYLGPIAPIILENLPYIISFFALFFIFRRFLNIINENLGIKNELAALIAAIATYFFWPFVIPILIVAFTIKVFRVGISKLESLKTNLSKINTGLAHLFSKTISDIKHFNEDTDKIIKDINKLDKIISHPYIKNLIDSIEKDIKTLNNIINHLLKETENERLTLHMLSAYSSKFNATCNNAKIKIEQLNRIINTMFINPNLLRRFGNKIFRTNKFTPKYLMELRNIPNDLNKRLETVHNDGQKIFKELYGLLASTENINEKLKNEIHSNLDALKRSLNNVPLPSNDRNKMQKEIKEIEGKANAILKSNMSPFQIEEELAEIRKQINKVSKILQRLRRDIRQGKSGIYVKEENKLKKELESSKRKINKKR